MNLKKLASMVKRFAEALKADPAAHGVGCSAWERKTGVTLSLDAETLLALVAAIDAMPENVDALLENRKQLIANLAAAYGNANARERRALDAETAARELWAALAEILGILKHPGPATEMLMMLAQRGTARRAGAALARHASFAPKDSK